jgi:hypothetical protein
MVRPDDGAVDHVGTGIAFHHLRQRFEHRVEHAGRHPAPVAPKHAVPLAIFIGKLPPLRAGAGDPHHALEIQPVILRRAAATAALRRQQHADNLTFLVRKPDPLGQCRRQKPALIQQANPLSTFVRDA